MSTSHPGRLIVVSGPSGAGKTTVLKEVFARSKRPLVLSVSATTRPPRAGERNGVDYHFLSADEFQTRRANGEFLECFEVFGRGHWYGTLHDEVTPRLAEGKWVVLEIDVQGADAVVAQFPDAVTFFVRPSPRGIGATPASEGNGIARSDCPPAGNRPAGNFAVRPLSPPHHQRRHRPRHPRNVPRPRRYQLTTDH